MGSHTGKGTRQETPIMVTRKNGHSSQSSVDTEIYPIRHFFIINFQMITKQQQHLSTEILFKNVFLQRARIMLAGD